MKKEIEGYAYVGHDGEIDIFDILEYSFRDSNGTLRYHQPLYSLGDQISDFGKKKIRIIIEDIEK